VTEIDRVSELEERADAVVFAERGASGLKKGLRGDHQDVHRGSLSVPQARPAGGRP
jgi:hypothetical protein